MVEQIETGNIDLALVKTLSDSLDVPYQKQLDLIEGMIIAVEQIWKPNCSMQTFLNNLLRLRKEALERAYKPVVQFN